MATRKKKTRPKTRRVIVRLTDDEGRQLEELAERNDRTVSAEVRRALRRHFQAEAGGPGENKTTTTSAV